MRYKVWDLLNIYCTLMAYKITKLQKWLFCFQQRIYLHLISLALLVSFSFSFANFLFIPHWMYVFLRWKPNKQISHHKEQNVAENLQKRHQWTKTNIMWIKKYPTPLVVLDISFESNYIYLDLMISLKYHALCSNCIQFVISMHYNFICFYFLGPRALR